ncbi:MAG: FecR domain-containing protein [Labilithrix sp.]|nr:FecR domain-containing protein [Labilithrix sp.]MCW5809366.1 FecR domain-containing protein [Labilithrix sp.]
MRRALMLTLMVVAAPAFAEEGVRHTVKAGDTCAGIAQRYYGDARLVDVLHKANPAIGALPPPHTLKEGTVILVPPKPTSNEAPDARLTTVRNRVDVLTPETRPGKPKDPLFRGNRVSTEASSSADVTFRDESQVKLGERTLVVILGDVRSAARTASKEEATTASTSLVTGHLRAFLSPKSKAPIAVETPAAAVRVREGEAQVGSDDKKAARLAVYAGRSSISAQGTTRDVVPGFGSKAELGKAPTVPKPLPPAPVWTKAPQRVLLARASSTPSIIGEYDEPADAKQHPTEWHVQVGKDDLFRELVVDEKVPVATKRFEGKTPGPGRYWIRVSAIDDDFEGPFSAVLRVLVVRPTITQEDAEHRRVEVEPANAPCMRVGNVRLTWVRAPIVAETLEPIWLRCAPAETDPTMFLDVDRLDDFPSPQ